MLSVCILPISAFAASYFVLNPLVSLAPNESWSLQDFGRIVGGLTISDSTKKNNLNTKQDVTAKKESIAALLSLTTHRQKLLLKRGWIDKQEIKQLLSADDKENLKKVGFEMLGPNRVMLKLKQDYSKPELVIGQAKRFLSQQIMNTVNNPTIRYIGTSLLRVPKNASLEFSSEGHSEHSSRRCVWAHYYSDKKQRQKVPLWFEVSGEIEVYRLTQDVSAGTAFDSTKVAVVSTEIQNLEGRAPLAKFDDAALRFVGPYRAGRLITKGMLQTLPAVVNGERVVVDSMAGKVKIRSTANAVSEGDIGDWVTLRSDSSNTLFKAQVVDRNLVVVGSNHRQ